MSIHNETTPLLPTSDLHNEDAIKKKPSQFLKQSSASIATLLILLVTFTTIEYLVLKYNLPDMTPQDKKDMKLPKSLNDLRRMNQVLEVYIEQHFIRVYTTFITSYIYLQSFSIPGSLWLSILGGALFPFWFTLVTVAMCSAIGATLSYLISKNLGSVFVLRLIGERANTWKEQFSKHKKDMLNYMIVLRIAPLPPNWCVNLGSPHFGVPLITYFIGTFLGVIPPSFIHVQAGAALDRISTDDHLVLLTWKNVLCLLAVGIVALIPIFLRRHTSH